jgi:hypothetical protein
MVRHLRMKHRADGGHRRNKRRRSPDDQILELLANPLVSRRAIDHLSSRNPRGG